MTLKTNMLAASLLVVVGSLATCQGNIAGIAKECLEPLSRGPCRAFFPSFYYDSNAKECNCFVYGGCQGNGNRFGSLETCMRTCNVKTKDQLVSETCLNIFGSDLKIPHISEAAQVLLDSDEKHESPAGKDSAEAVDSGLPESPALLAGVLKTHGASEQTFQMDPAAARPQEVADTAVVKQEGTGDTRGSPAFPSIVYLPSGASTGSLAIGQPVLFGLMPNHKDNHI